jgi:hypothetical protein
VRSRTTRLRIAAWRASGSIASTSDDNTQRILTMNITSITPMTEKNTNGPFSIV